MGRGSTVSDHERRYTRRDGAQVGARTMALVRDGSSGRTTRVGFLRASRAQGDAADLIGSSRHAEDVITIAHRAAGLRRGPGY